MTMGNNKDLYPWLLGSWSHLIEYLGHQRIPQAVMISGQKGLGKQRLAWNFAKSLLCEQRTSEFRACSQCSSCQLFSAKTHPDFTVIQPEESGKSISIDQIRGLTSFLSLSSQFNNYRLLIINDAHRLTHAAANSFLKNLEEPVEKTCIILISGFPSALPATIRSRCQILFVPAPKSKVAMHWLQQQQISEHLDILLEIAQGSPLIALEYAKDGVLESRKSCFNDWLKISRQQASPIIIAEHWLQFPDSLLLFWMISWVVDTLKCYFNQNPDKCYNSDFESSLQELAQRLELKRLFKFYDLLLRQKQHLTSQLNKQLIFEEILINWSQLCKK